jgi:hypothetical protein
MRRHAFAFAPHPRAYRADPADWRIAPVSGLGLPISILRGLIEEGVDTAGELWPLVESRELARSMGFSLEQYWKVERALIALRDAAGDPAPRRWR